MTCDIQLAVAKALIVNTLHAKFKTCIHTRTCMQSVVLSVVQLRRVSLCTAQRSCGPLVLMPSTIGINRAFLATSMLVTSAMNTRRDRDIVLSHTDSDIAAVHVYIYTCACNLG
jgi:hypothetical protein